MTDKLKRLREWVQQFVDERKVRGDFMLSHGALAEIDRLLAEPEAPPTDAEVDAAMYQFGQRVFESEKSKADPRWFADLLSHNAIVSIAHQNLRVLIARKVEAARGDGALLAAAKAVVAHWETHGIVGVLKMPELIDELWNAIAAREAGGAQ